MVILLLSSVNFRESQQKGRIVHQVNLRCRPIDINAGEPFIGFLVGCDKARRIFFFGASSMACELEADKKSFDLIETVLTIGSCYKLRFSGQTFYLDALTGENLFTMYG